MFGVLLAAGSGQAYASPPPARASPDIPVTSAAAAPLP